MSNPVSKTALVVPSKPSAEYRISRYAVLFFTFHKTCTFTEAAYYHTSLHDTKHSDSKPVTSHPSLFACSYFALLHIRGAAPRMKITKFPTLY